MPARLLAKRRVADGNQEVRVETDIPCERWIWRACIGLGVWRQQPVATQMVKRQANVGLPWATICDDFPIRVESIGKLRGEPQAVDRQGILLSQFDQDEQKQRFVGSLTVARFVDPEVG